MKQQLSLYKIDPNYLRYMHSLDYRISVKYNNMFPVVDGVYSLLEIDAEKDTYESNEIRFIRKHSEAIINKAQKVYTNRTEKSDWFMEKICCDFKKLENKSCEYIEPTELH